VGEHHAAAAKSPQEKQARQKCTWKFDPIQSLVNPVWLEDEELPRRVRGKPSS
jgi:hypothetical protein